MSDVVVIGGGPAGMMAAITASQYGHSVTLIEKNEITGRKLLITGKGRCNVTNNCTENEFIENVTVNPRFMYSAINTFTCADTMAFFENEGVPLKTERGRRVFPQSDKAHDIVYAMRRALQKNKIKVVRDTIQSVLCENGAVTGVKGRNAQYVCDAAVIATGGLSYPLTGSTGDGYKMARQLGHTVTPLTPSLISLKTKETLFFELTGLALKNIEIRLVDESGKLIYKDFGELLFTHFGVSGPVILSASAHVPKGKRTFLIIDLKPALTEKQLDARLLREFEGLKNSELKSAMRKLLPSNMGALLCEWCDIAPETPVNAVTKEQRATLISALKGLKLEITGTGPIEEAIVTSGGISVKEINPKTMESKLVSGLFFAGEVIDVDAYTGGYNLQIAFSTGYLAGSSI